jgi:uncharacterized membrane protein
MNDDTTPATIVAIAAVIPGVQAWFLYRVVRGWMRLGASEAMPS